MAVYSARQSTYVDGDVITAADSNDEFDTILAAFHATTGHPHDGTAGGGPLLVATGALNVGSITSGFGNIDNGASNVTSGGLVKLDVDADADDLTGDSATGRLTLGAGEDLNLYHGGTNSYIVNDTGDLILDTAGDIVLDADGGDIFFKDAATTFGSATNTSGNLIIKSGTTTALTFSGANATFAGTVTIGSAEISETELEILDGALLTTTELNLIDGDTARGTTSLASGDGILINDAGTMRMTNVDTVSTYFAGHSVGGTSIVTTGALDAGSITSNFGTIDTGSSTITTTGAITGGSVVADDISLNGKVIVMTGDTDDTVTMTADANGAFSLVTVDTAAAAGNIQITADGTFEVDGTTITLDSAGAVVLDGGTTIDIDSGGILTLDSGAAINIEPASGSAILLDGTISIDAGVVTGATSITSTTFVGALTGNASGTAATVTGAAQTNITSLGTLTALTVDDIAINTKSIVMTGDTDDTVTMTAAAHGAFSITTVDDAAAAGHITLDADGDIILDADGGDIFFKDATTTFGSATNNSGDLIIKSGTTTAATFSGANLALAGTLTATTSIAIGSASLIEAELEALDALARGSIIVGNSSAATATLTIGGNTQVLTSDGTDITWEDAASGGLSAGDIIGADDGAVGAPGLTFADDLDNGFYRIGADNWAAATAGSKVMEFSGSNVDIPDLNLTSLAIKSHKIQCFLFELKNVSGTLKHRIILDSGNEGGGNFDGQVDGASTTLTTTPLLSSSVDFATGCGIDAAVTYRVYFKATAAQVAADLVGSVHVVRDSAMGVEPVVDLQTISKNVNGTTLLYPVLNFFDGAGTFPLTTSNITTGNVIHVRVLWFIK